MNSENYLIKRLGKVAYLTQTFLLAEDSKRIENEFVLVLKINKVKTVTELTTNLISLTKSLHFKEFIKL